MRVFVHDATGYIGAAVVEVLAAAEHEVVGSVFAGREFEYGPASALAERADAADVDAANSLLLSAEAVVFPAEGAAEEARAALRLLKNGGYEGEKRFILVSTLMTWAKSKQPEDGAGLKEEDYTKRKAAARYRDLKTLESQCKAVAKENLGTVVISAGILYGRGEDVLHGLFRQAWMCSPPALPVLAGAQGGANKLPMIHVSDLARVVAAACESLPEVPYVVAADSSQCTLREVVEAISTGLGTGKTRDLSREETQDVMLEDASASNLNVNLVFDVDSSTSHSIGIEWESQDGILANIDTVITQFKKVRDLRPVRAVIAGPPASGFKDVARSVSEKYYLEIVTRESAVAAATADPEPRTPPAGDAEEGEEVEEPEPTEAGGRCCSAKGRGAGGPGCGGSPRRAAVQGRPQSSELQLAAIRAGSSSDFLLREVVGVFGAAEELEDGVGTEDDGEPARGGRGIPAEAASSWSRPATRTVGLGHSRPRRASLTKHLSRRHSKHTARPMRRIMSAARHPT